MSAFDWESDDYMFVQTVTRFGSIASVASVCKVDLWWWILRICLFWNRFWHAWFGHNSDQKHSTFCQFSILTTIRWQHGFSIVSKVVSIEVRRFLYRWCCSIKHVRVVTGNSGGSSSIRICQRSWMQRLICYCRFILSSMQVDTCTASACRGL